MDHACCSAAALAARRAPSTLPDIQSTSFLSLFGPFLKLIVGSRIAKITPSIHSRHCTPRSLSHCGCSCALRSYRHHAYLAPCTRAGLFVPPFRLHLAPSKLQFLLLSTVSFRHLLLLTGDFVEQFRSQCRLVQLAQSLAAASPARSASSCLTRPIRGGTAYTAQQASAAARRLPPWPA